MKKSIFYVALLSFYSYTTLSYALPDVVVSSVSYANGIFKSTIKNQGNSGIPAEKLIGVSYFVDGVHQSWTNAVGPLAAGASATVSTENKPYTIPTGTHIITAYVDDVDRFQESNENNNALNLTIGILGSNATSGTNTTSASNTTSENSTTVVGQTGISGGGTFSSKRFDQIKAMGAKWVRFGMNWRWVLPDNPTTYKWQGTDLRVEAIVDRGMQPLAVLATTPAWARPSNCSDSQWCAPSSTKISDFAKFAAAAAQRYPQIRVWEIWNEPNHPSWWKPNADPVKYAALLKATYKAIKAVNPDAIVITGGTSPAKTKGGYIAPVEFLQRIYNNGGGGSFDGVGHHPYCYDAKDECPDFFANWSAWSQMNDTDPSLRSVMIEHGDDDLKIWATEFGAPTGGGSRASTETQQANALTSAYDLFRSYSWAGPVLIWHRDLDRCQNTSSVQCYFGLMRYDGSKKLAYDAFVEASQ